MSCLYIAEKPSLGRAIAAVLPRPHKNNTGYIEVGNGDIVTWCIGHLLEQVEPDAYDARYKKWHLDDLPIVPQQWQLIPRQAAKQQLAVIKKLAKTATSVVHAGDPDAVTINCQQFDNVFITYNSNKLDYYSCKLFDSVRIGRCLTKLRCFIDSILITIDCSALKRITLFIRRDNKFLYFRPLNVNDFRGFLS